MRWEVFNILNHPNFQLPNRNFDVAAAGMITAVRTAEQSGAGYRMMQLSLKYLF